MSPLLSGMVLHKVILQVFTDNKYKKKKTLWDKMLYNFYSLSVQPKTHSVTLTQVNDKRRHTHMVKLTVTPDFTQHNLSRRTRTVCQMEFCRPWVFFFCCPVSSLDGFTFSNPMKRVNISGLILE